MDEEAKEKDGFLEDVGQYQKTDHWLTNNTAAFRV